MFLVAIEKRLGEPMNMAQWTAYFAFDVTEDLAFNKSSSMLRDGTDSYIFTKIRGDMRKLGISSRLAWLSDIYRKAPIVNRSFWRFWKWVQSRLDERMDVSPCPFPPPTLGSGLSASLSNFFASSRMSQTSPISSLGSWMSSTGDQRPSRTFTD
jgi:hypothetical protein